MLNLTATAILLLLTFFGGLSLAIEAGWRLGRRRRIQDPETATVGTGPVEGAIFGLMGLLIAFAFSGSVSRFEKRRELIVQEANTIGTAYLRLDLLPATAQPGLKEDFRDYVDSRLAVYRALPDIERAKAALHQSAVIQGRIWTEAVAAAKEANNPAVTSLVLSNLNDMIDITTTRTAALQTHSPLLVFIVLGMMVLASALYAGYSMAAAKSRNWIYRLGFALLMTVAVYLIVDLEFPRVGFIRIDHLDQLLVDVRAQMK